MRRKDRSITEKEAIALLNHGEYGVLSTVSKDETPYGVPLNFCLIDNCIYFHCAVEGHKLENIEHNKHISFCVVENVKVLPDKFATKYESVIVFGETEEVFDTEKQTALEALLHKYSSQFMEEGKKYIKNSKEQTRVFRIHIRKLNGKARK